MTEFIIDPLRLLKLRVISREKEIRLNLRCEIYIRKQSEPKSCAKYNCTPLPDRSKKARSFRVVHETASRPSPFHAPSRQELFPHPAFRFMTCDSLSALLTRRSLNRISPYLQGLGSWHRPDTVNTLQLSVRGSAETLEPEALCGLFDNQLFLKTIACQ